MSGRYFEDFEPDQEFTVGGRTMTETDIVIVAALIHANAPVFFNEEYAKKESPYGGRIAPGELTLSFAMAATEPLFHGTMVGLVGIDKVRFYRPVKPGDTIHNVVRVAMKRVTSKPERGVITFADSVRNQRGEEVCTFEHTVLIKTRGA